MTVQSSSASSPARLRPSSAPTGSSLTSGEGTTTIADGVVQKIAGMAATDVPGVYRLGGGAANAISSLRTRLPGSSTPSVTQGISVAVGRIEATADINLTVEYGFVIPEVVAAVRGRVISAVTRMTGLTVTNVDVTVDDVHLPTDNDNDPGHA